MTQLPQTLILSQALQLVAQFLQKGELQVAIYFFAQIWRQNNASY